MNRWCERGSFSFIRTARLNGLITDKSRGPGVYVPATEQCQVCIVVLIDGEESQTNNTAELLVAITAFRLFNTVLAHVCVVTDSEYVYLGATGKAEKWRSQGWMGSNGLLSNVHFWVELLELIEELGPRLHWLWAPSHVGLEGNEVANGLAVEGMYQSPFLGGVHGGQARAQGHNESSGDSTVLWVSLSSGSGRQLSSIGREDFGVSLGDEESEDIADSGSTRTSELREEMMRRNCSLHAKLLSGYEDGEGTTCGPNTNVCDEEGYRSRKRARRLLGP